MGSPFEQCELEIESTLSRDELDTLWDLDYDLMFPRGQENILLLGNYSDGNEELLERMRDRINTESGRMDSGDEKYRAFLLTDFPNDVDATAELAVALENCAYIFFILTEDTGGVGLETGMAANTADLDRTHIMKKVYDDEDAEYDSYSYMFAESLFNHYQASGSLWTWKEETELEAKLRRLIGSIPSIP